MAKKTDTGLKGLFEKTTQEGQPDNSDLDTGIIQAQGVGLKTGEVQAIQQIANSTGVAKNAVMRLAVRKFILDVRSGKIDPADYFEEPEAPAKKFKPPV